MKYEFVNKIQIKTWKDTEHKLSDSLKEELMKCVNMWCVLSDFWLVNLGICSQGYRILFLLFFLGGGEGLNQESFALSHVVVKLYERE